MLFPTRWTARSPMTWPARWSARSPQRRRMRRHRLCPRPWCCCRRPAPPMTSSRISSSAAMPSAPWWRGCRRMFLTIRGRHHERLARRQGRFRQLVVHGGQGALVAMAALIGIGLMLAFAASPAITGGPLTAGDFRYAARQLTFAGVALAIHGRGLAAVAAPDQDRGGRWCSPPRWRGPSWCCSWAPMCWARGAS